jgi:hypothetical protein
MVVHRQLSGKVYVLLNLQGLLNVLKAGCEDLYYFILSSLAVVYCKSLGANILDYQL